MSTPYRGGVRDLKNWNNWVNKVNLAHDVEEVIYNSHDIYGRWCLGPVREPY